MIFSKAILNSPAEEEHVIPGEVFGTLRRRSSQERLLRKVLVEFTTDLGGAHPIGVFDGLCGTCGGRMEAAWRDECHSEILELEVLECPT